MGRTPKTEPLVLQIFPRGDPSRAVTYAGDQEYIRQLLRDLARRLEETRDLTTAHNLRLLREEEGQRGNDAD